MKVEVDVLGSASLTVGTVSVDVNQHLKKKTEERRVGAWLSARALTLESQGKPHDRALWSPHGWVTVMCLALRPPLGFHRCEILC